MGSLHKKSINTHRVEKIETIFKRVFPKRSIRIDLLRISFLVFCCVNKLETEKKAHVERLQTRRSKSPFFKMESSYAWSGPRCANTHTHTIGQGVRPFVVSITRAPIKHDGLLFAQTFRFLCSATHKRTRAGQRSSVKKFVLFNFLGFSLSLFFFLVRDLFVFALFYD